MNRFLSILFLLFCFSDVQSATVDIRSFGVQGNDQLDDTQNFDKAIEHMAEHGGTLLIPKGNYYLDNNKRTRKGVYNNGYIFLIHSSFTIKFEKGAILYYKNLFKGFRFRSTKDPNERTINKFSVAINGGVIDGRDNFKTNQKGNPDMWGFVAETLQSFIVKDAQVRNFYGTAGFASYSNDFTNISGNQLLNVTGNPNDFIDNHGDGIYVANTHSYIINNNKIANNLSGTNRIGRIGICIEYEQSKNGEIIGNDISGYDRGIHVELISGTATISGNKMSGNSSGVVLWNNHGYPQIIKNNVITNKPLPTRNKPILYTSAPILLLGYNSNLGTLIENNIIYVEKGFFMPNSLIDLTSSNMKVINNKFFDYSQTLALSISQGKSHIQRVNHILFQGNEVMGRSVYAFDGSYLSVLNNTFQVTEITVSFDETKNLFKGNIVPKAISPQKIKVLGRYEN